MPLVLKLIVGATVAAALLHLMIYYFYSKDGRLVRRVDLVARVIVVIGFFLMLSFPIYGKGLREIFSGLGLFLLW